MNIGFISTRLAGNDGVSLGAFKLAEVLQQMNQSVYYCAGELDDERSGHLDPGLHFKDPTAAAFGERAFGKGGFDDKLLLEIGERANDLQRPLRQFINQFSLRFLIIQNAFASVLFRHLLIKD